MKSIVFIAFFLTITLCCGQSNDTHTLLGNINTISYYQGGMAIDRSAILPVPYTTSIWITRFTESTSVPQAFRRIQPDENGDFEIELPMGIYGFALEQEIDSLHPMQTLPLGSNTMGELNAQNKYWTASLPMPLQLAKSETITLTYYDITTCYLCP